MRVESCEIPDVILVQPKVFRDARGYFVEVYNRRTMSAAGITDVFVQDNVSYSAAAFTIRGLHFQTGVDAQAKLVRVIKGRILDVAVDLRGSSPTYGRHVLRELDAESGAQLYVPVGFAHAFCTLEPDCIVGYKVTSFYAPASDGGVLWSDPDLAIAWPVEAAQVVLSDKDAGLPLLCDIDPGF